MKHYQQATPKETAAITQVLETMTQAPPCTCTRCKAEKPETAPLLPLEDAPSAVADDNELVAKYLEEMNGVMRVSCENKAMCERLLCHYILS